MSGRVLVVGVGNVLRGDDGFGVAVARRLAERERLPPGVDLIETGIGGLGVVHELMRGYEMLIVVDAVDQDAPPGTVFVLQPEVPDPAAIPAAEWQRLFSNLHLAEPYRVFLLAKLVGALPDRVFIVGCQPGDGETVSERLSGPVEAALPVAIERVRGLLEMVSPSGAAERTIQRCAR